MLNASLTQPHNLVPCGSVSSGDVAAQSLGWPRQTHSAAGKKTKWFNVEMFAIYIYISFWLAVLHFPITRIIFPLAASGLIDVGVLTAKMRTCRKCFPTPKNDLL